MLDRIRRVFPWALLLGLVLAASAPAAETYDLAELLVREPKAGGPPVREVSSELERGRQVVRQKGQIVQDQSATKREAYARKVEVLRASKEGDALESRYTYESYTRAQGETQQVLEVAGLVVTVDQSQPDQPAKITPGGERQVPPFLENKLQDEAQQPNRAERLEKVRLLLPAERVGVGATWSKTPQDAATALGFDADGLDAGASRLAGKLGPGSEPGALKLVVEVSLRYQRYQGMRCLEPVVLQVTIEAEFPAGGDDPTGTLNQTLDLKGVLATPQGHEVEIQVHQETKTEISALAK